MSLLDSSALGKQIKDDVFKSLGDAINTYTPKERELISRCAENAGEIALMAMLGLGEKAAEQKKFVDAQLANIKVAGSATASKLVWSVTEKILNLGLKLVISLV